MKIIIISFLSWGFIPFTFSQNADHIDGGHFIKRIEYNLLAKGRGDNSIIFIDRYNLSSKGDIEKLFFGDFNANVEFFFDPSFEGALGFRIMKDSLNVNNFLEIKCISNYDEATKEALKEARDKRNLIDVPVELLNTLPRSVFNLIWEYNSNAAISKRYFEELPKRFNVVTLSFPISEQFADKMYKKMVWFIDNFKAKGVPPTMVDGYYVTFRTVVEDEVWSLLVHEPQGNALIMSDLCRQIITDAIANQLDESKYLTILNTFDR